MGIEEAAIPVVAEGASKGAEAAGAAAAGADVLAPAAGFAAADTLAGGLPFAAGELAPAGALGAAPELFGAPAAGVVGAEAPLASVGPASAFAAAPAAAGIETAGTGIGILDELPAVDATLASAGLGPAAGVTPELGVVPGAFAEAPQIADIPFSISGLDPTAAASLPTDVSPVAATDVPFGAGAGIPAADAAGGGVDLALGAGPAGAIDPPISASVPGGAVTPAASPLSPGLSGVAPGGGVAASPAGGGGLLDFFKANPTLTTALALGAGGQLLSRLNQLPAEKQLKAIAAKAGAQSDALSAEGAPLRASLETGTLMPGQQASLDAALNDAIVATKSKYASLGMPGSTAEQDQINYLKLQAERMKVDMEKQNFDAGMALAGTAANELGLTEGIYAQLLNVQVANDNALQQAIGRFAGAAALGTALKTRAA